MSEERFDRIDERLDRLEVGLQDLTGRVALRSDLAAFKTEVSGDFAAFKTEVRGDFAAFKTEVRSDFGALKAEVRSDVGTLREEMRTTADELRRHMGVLHEEAMDRIASTREYNGPTREDMADLKEMIGRRLDPLEATVRQHSADIEQLKQTRG